MKYIPYFNKGELPEREFFYNIESSVFSWIVRSHKECNQTRKVGHNNDKNDIIDETKEVKRNRVYCYCQLKCWVFNLHKLIKLV